MTVSLSVEGNNLRIVNSSGKKIDKWDSVSFDPQLLREGLITDTTQMAQTIKQALRGNCPQRMFAGRYPVSAVPHRH